MRVMPRLFNVVSIAVVFFVFLALLPARQQLFSMQIFSLPGLAVFLVFFYATAVLISLK